MGQIYNGTLIIQTKNYDSPTGDYILAPVANPAQSGDVKDSKQGYDGAGNIIVGTNEGGYAGEVSSYEEMDSYLTEENVGRILKYIGEEKSEGGQAPIELGDKLTKLYFDTTKTPDFSSLDWENADDTAGEDVRKIGLIELSPAMGESYAEKRITANYNTRTKEYFLALWGLIPLWVSETGWNTNIGNSYDLTSMGVESFEVIEVKHQDIWNSYMSKEPFSGGSEPKYKTNQTYIIEQKDGEIKALPLTE